MMLCLGVSLALIGCGQSQPMTDLGPQLDTDGVRRSVALDPSLLHHLRTSQPGYGAQAWYEGRNDRTLAVSSGYDLPTLQSSYTLTRDRQYTSNGRVHDTFSATTYRSEYRQSIR